MASANWYPASVKPVNEIVTSAEAADEMRATVANPERNNLLVIMAGNLSNRGKE
jgi:hypothetical protein